MYNLVHCVEHIRSFKSRWAHCSRSGKGDDPLHAAQNVAKFQNFSFAQSRAYILQILWSGIFGNYFWGFVVNCTPVSLLISNIKSLDVVCEIYDMYPRLTNKS